MQYIPASIKKTLPLLSVQLKLSCFSSIQCYYQTVYDLFKLAEKAFLNFCIFKKVFRFWLSTIKAEYTVEEKYDEICLASEFIVWFENVVEEEIISFIVFHMNL